MPDATRTADQPTNSLADPATTTGGEPSAGRSAPPPSAGDRYALGSEIARGGMGAVYRATDAVLGREVAVKVLQEKYGPGSAAARRFADEARITAQLQHPAIPPVHDLGTLPDGRPFLAMKLVKGRTLEDLLKARTDPAADRGRLVAAFEAACQAVGYAHAHGVIHRDLKPANVMVGSFGEVQVMDWGLAKVLAGGGRRPPEADPDATSAGGTEVHGLRDGEDQFTQAGSVLGTPAYMPREQAIGAVDQVDRRSDVFGLGGILAAVLTGQPPFVGETAESTRQLAAVGKVADCFERLDACGADPELVALCKRCLAPEKADRPADAGEVAKAVAALRQAADERARLAELDRVRAEGEKAAAEVRAAEQRRRARLRLAVLGLAAVLAAAGGAFAWYSDRQAAAERDRLGRNAEAVTALLDQAEAALKAGDAAKAAPLLDAADARAGEGGADESAGRRESLRADLGVLRELDGAERYRWAPDGPQPPDPAKVAARYRSALATFGADPDAAGPEAAAGRVAGSAVRDRLVAALDYVLWQGGLPAARAALRLLDPDPLRGLVRDAWAAGRAPAAVAGPAAASAVLTGLPGRVGAADQPPGFVAVLGDDGAVPAGVRRVLLGTAIQRRPADPGLLLAMGYTYRMNRWDTADERARWYQAAVAASPDNPVPHTLLGSAMRDRGDHDGAVACHREAVRLAPNYAMAHNNLGHALWRKGDLDGAVAEYREAIRLDPNHALAHDNLGAALAGKGDWEGSEWECREAIRLDPSHAMAHSNLGYHLKRRGDLDGAVAEYREAIRLDPNHALAHVNLGWVLEQRGDLDGAVAEYREGLRADPTNAKAHNSLGWVLQQKGELEEAVSSYKEALRLDPKQPYAVANLPRAERMRTLLPRLPGVLAGTDRPATPAEALGFAELCGQPFQGRYAAAARLYEHAFALDPALADVLFTSAGGHRYDAACYAARAARGDGVDAPADPAGRAALRAQALSWLRADLAVRQKQAASQAGSERRAAAAALAHWLGDSDLSAVRHPLVLAALPAAEAREWLALWADVRWTLAEAHKPAPPPEAAPPPRAK